MKEEKAFDFKVTLVFEERVHAKNKREALKKLIEGFYQDYGLHITGEEIESI